MSVPTLRIALGACALFAFTPILTWFYGLLFNDRWRETLGSLAVTLPIGLGVAAFVLAVHGLLVNREIAELMFEDLEVAMAAVTAEPTSPVGVFVGVTSGASAATATSATSASAAAPPARRVEAPLDDEQTPAKDDKKPGRFGTFAKKAGTRGVRKIKSRGSSVARRQARSRMPRM